MAIISKCNHSEQSLAEAFLRRTRNSEYFPPLASLLCELAIKIVQILEQIHAKRVQHGNLRPDVIGFWIDNNETRTCIRDFTESRLLPHDGPSVNISDSELNNFIIRPSNCLHYLSPEAVCGIHAGFLIHSHVSH